VIRFTGAAYLLFMGVKFLMSKDTIISVNPIRQRSFRAIYLRGVVTNLLNPKAALFTLSFVPQFVAPELGPIWSQMLFLGLIIVTVMILVDLPIVLAAGGFAEWLERRSSAASVLGKLMGLLLIGLAVYVAITRRPA
jgi:threonine/homoserine/homoserine lactone efflux protein